MIKQLNEQVVPNGASVLSEDLTTTTPLLSGATYTSPSVRNSYLQVSVSCQTDVDSILYFEFSNDNIVWNIFPVLGFMVNANIHTYHTARKENRYFRVRLVNGASNQTYLRLYIYFGDSGLPNAPLNQRFAPDVDAIITRNPYDSIEVSLGNSNTIDSNDAPKYAFNPTLASSTEETIWTHSSRWVRGTVDSTVSIVSSSGDDILGGTGARTIRIFGINSTTGARDFEDINMNGIGTVVSTKTWVLGGMNRVLVTTSGSNDTNVGNITVTHTLEGSVQAYIAIGDGSTEQMIYTVPDDGVILLDGILFNASKILGGGGLPRIQINGYRYLLDGTRARFMRFVIDTAVTNELKYGFAKFPAKITGVRQFELTAISDTNNGFISAIAYYANVSTS